MERTITPEEYLDNQAQIDWQVSMVDKYSYLRNCLRMRISSDELLIRYNTLTKQCEELQKVNNDLKNNVSWDQYQRDKTKYNEAAESTKKINKFLTINRLGIYNCDVIGRFESPSTILATYKDEEGKKMNIILIQVLDSKINGLLEYNGAAGFHPGKFIQE